MDMRRFSGQTFLKVDDVRAEPLREIIASIKLGKYDKPDLHFESGDLLSLNATNNAVLIRAYGWDSDSWIGKEIELYVGEIEFQNKPIDAVLVKPISPALKQNERTKPPTTHDPMNDEVPF
jgi:hypothetical protein